MGFFTMITHVIKGSISQSYHEYFGLIKPIFCKIYDKLSSPSFNKLSFTKKSNTPSQSPEQTESK